MAKKGRLAKREAIPGSAQFGFVRTVLVVTLSPNFAGFSSGGEKTEIHVKAGGSGHSAWGGYRSAYPIVHKGE
jgi:hypothetical protein